MPVRRRANTEVLQATTAQAVIVDRTTLPTRGVLFIGDPHVSTVGPKRRQVAEPDWLGMTLRKLGEAAEIANTRQLQALCPGDLVDDPRDLNQVLQVRLIRTLKRFARTLATTVGNHDKKGTQLADDEVMTLLAETGMAEVINVSAFWGRLILTAEDGRTHRLVVGMTPYGFAPPTSLAHFMGLPEGTDAAQAKAAAEADTVLWLTHADYAFEGAYPGAAELVEIPGVDMVINGHMHGVKKPVVVGRTVWYCPGNIVRWSVDQAEHVPQVWAWSPFDPETMASASGVRVPRLEGVALAHTPGAQAFSFEGRHAEASLLDADAVAPVMASSFVAGLQATKQAMARGSDSTVARELTQVITDLAIPAPAQTVLERLMADASHSLHQATS